MDFNEYQTLALRTWTPPPRDKKIDISYLALGLTNEAGEVAGKIKKYLRGDIEELDREGLAAELGDVLWYLTTLSAELGIDANIVAQMNIDKLASRKQRGVIKGDGDNR